MKILIFKTGALGDVLMTTPFVRQLREIFPDAEIIYYVGKYAYPVIKNNPYITRIETFDQNLFFKYNIFKFSRLQRKIRKEKFDMAFILDKHYMYGILVADIHNSIGFVRENHKSILKYNILYKDAKHEIYYYLDLLKLIGVRPDYDDNKMDLIIPKHVQEYANFLIKPGTVGFACGGGGNNPGESGYIRRFPVDKYAEFINMLPDKDIVLFGSLQDEEVNKYIISKVKDKNIKSMCNSNIDLTAAMMKRCRLVVTHDAGPMHLASAVGCKTMTFFGPTNPIRKAPLSKNSSIWKDSDMYEEDYEIYGKMPKPGKPWFRGVDIECLRKYMTIQ